jgi:thiol:disulfide interchange protein/DsbC/DsbD-like thiol-disulfide interchange protein
MSGNPQAMIEVPPAAASGEFFRWDCVSSHAPHAFPMKPFRIPLLCALGLAAAASSLRAQVEASLVAADASVQAGHPFTVALHFVHQPTWHTYWLNPGTGLATTLTWKLPPGWKAGDIQWPAPEVLTDKDHTVVGNGYEGDLLLPVTLTPPADLPAGAPVELSARADWLMCQNVCKPGSAQLTLALPVGSGSPPADPQWGAKIRAVIAALPAADAGWRVAANRTGKTAITLDVAPSGKGPAAQQPAYLHFFSDDNLIAYDQPQAFAGDGQGGWKAELTVSPDGPAAATLLHGVLTADPGWRPDGSLPGLRIDIPLGGAAILAAGAAPGTASAPEAMGGPPPPATNLIATLALAFVGGLILNLMPCVFPVIGIKILGFVKQSGAERGKVVAHGLIFSAGVILSFWVLAAILAVLRQGGAQLGWGFQLQSPLFIFCLAAAMLIFALNLSGVFEFGLTATSVGSSLQTKSGYSGSFFTGVLATLVATPCSAPFLAPALGAALTLSYAESFLVFTTIAVGLCTPYLLLSIFPGAVKALPRPGAWMETFKQFMAFPLYATVGYLLWVLAGQVPDSALLDAFFGLVIVATGIWTYGRSRALGASSGTSRFALVMGLCLVAAGVWTGWPRPPAPTDIAWAKWSPEAVAQLRADGRIVYVDFTARWCATCQANKKLVFHSAEVLQTFRDKNIATLRGDWTNQDPQITAELAKYHLSAVPFNQVWLPGQADPVLLPQLLSPHIVLAAVNQGH